MKIFFVRHGETTGDVEDRYGGDYDDHLSEKGVAQSKEVAEQLKDKGIQILISSPLIRARETSELITKAVGCSWAIRPEFKERNQYGILTGVVKAEAREKHPDMVEALKDRLSVIEGAESYEDFSVRIQKGFELEVPSRGRKQLREPYRSSKRPWPHEERLLPRPAGRLPRRVS